MQHRKNGGFFIETSPLFQVLVPASLKSNDIKHTLLTRVVRAILSLPTFDCEWPRPCSQGMYISQNQEDSDRGKMGTFLFGNEVRVILGKSLLSPFAPM